MQYPRKYAPQEPYTPAPVSVGLRPPQVMPLSPMVPFMGRPAQALPMSMMSAMQRPPSQVAVPPMPAMQRPLHPAPPAIQFVPFVPPAARPPAQRSTATTIEDVPESPVPRVRRRSSNDQSSSSSARNNRARTGDDQPASSVLSASTPFSAAQLDPAEPASSTQHDSTTAPVTSTVQPLASSAAPPVQATQSAAAHAPAQSGPSTLSAAAETVPGVVVEPVMIGANDARLQEALHLSARLRQYISVFDVVVDCQRVHRAEELADFYRAWNAADQRQEERYQARSEQNLRHLGQIDSMVELLRNVSLNNSQDDQQPAGGSNNAQNDQQSADSNNAQNDQQLLSSSSRILRPFYHAKALPEKVEMELGLESFCRRLNL
ncbi:hypothetical protein MBANPS3_012313 [Mucor bainieri]